MTRLHHGRSADHLLSDTIRLVKPPREQLVTATIAPKCAVQQLQELPAWNAS
jgi:hypothetical protein